MIVKDPEQFKKLVYKSQVDAIIMDYIQLIYYSKLTKKFMHFWDYGNHFYQKVEELMLIFDQKMIINQFFILVIFRIFWQIFSNLGFRPFRQICNSGQLEVLKYIDKIAEQVLIDLIPKSPKIIADQVNDNLEWIRKGCRKQICNWIISRNDIII
ncbi:unnamed protein product [Paramecium primaurelia]|uniref:Uncharacterized protein n=1 Tax=Paramecium primaurelia TaxID=5886 RepID=A0A8S1L714_PARPR|nr:unnamed protein product [Paramecium primaurelia]